MSASYRFSYVLEGADSHPVILFLHGFMGRKEDWDEITSASVSDFRTLAVDLPGHGETKVLGGDEGYGMAGCARGLIDLLDELDIRICTLVGYSMGGRLGFHMLAHYPVRFEKVVIESASPGLKSAAEREARAAQDDSLAARLEADGLEAFLSEWYNQPMFSSIRQDPVRFNRMLACRRKNDPAELAKSLRSMGAGAMEPLWDRLKEIRIPLLLVAGEQDEKYRSLVNETAALSGGIKTAIIKNSGHNVHFEQADTYIRIVRQFFLEKR